MTTALAQSQTPPHALDAEKAVLGSILLDNRVIPTVINILLKTDFYSAIHQRIYEAMIHVYDDDRPVDMMTVSNELKRTEAYEEAGGIAYLSSLEADVMVTTNVEYHALIVHDKARARALLAEVSEICNKCLDGDFESSDDLMSDAHHRIFQLLTHRKGTYFQHIADPAEERVEFVREHRGDHETITGLATHFEHLDRLTAGLQPSDSIILAARPSMGKTALALNIALQVALLEKKTVGVFSLEMSMDQIMYRLLAQLAQVPMNRIQSSYITEQEMARLEEKRDLLATAPLYIDDTAALSIREIEARARRLQAEHPDLALLVIDYLQLIRGPYWAAKQGKQREVAEISGQVKALAKNLDIPILSLSQLSRLIEHRETKKPARPKLSDLRESGAIEQDADTVMFIYRPAFGEEPPVDITRHDQQSEPVHARLILAKQRNGPTGEVQLLLVRQYTQFLTLAREYWDRQGD